MILAVTLRTPVPPPSFPVNSIQGFTIPISLLPPAFPAGLLPALTICNPCIIIIVVRIRPAIHRRRDIFPTQTATRAEKTSHLARNCPGCQITLRSGDNKWFSERELAGAGESGFAEHSGRTRRGRRFPEMLYPCVSSNHISAKDGRSGLNIRP